MIQKTLTENIDHVRIEFWPHGMIVKVHSRFNSYQPGFQFDFDLFPELTVGGAVNRVLTLVKRDIEAGKLR